MQTVLREPSRSAMLTAAARAAHRIEPPPWILDDPFAAGFAGDAGAAMLERVRERVTPDGLRSFVLWVCLRGRFTDDLVAGAIEGGVDQYAILGAGLDSFAYRRPALLEHATVFEVDHPASQAWKRARLDEMGVVAPEGVVFAALDFERETLRQGLERAGFDFGRPAVFSWMGVSMYLTVVAIAETLKGIVACASGSRLVMTYNQPFDIVDSFSRGVTSEIAAAVGEEGEPFLSLFSPAEAQSLVRAAGFVDVDDVGPMDLARRYLERGRDARLAAAQRVLVAGVP